MGNFCSIYHANFEKLVDCTKNHNKAVFLDKCIFWWQVSTYTLDDGKIWFTRTISQIAKELSLSERSISRYLEEFETKGLIARACKLSASNKEGFRVTKRLYIRITQKLLDVVQVKSEKALPPPDVSVECSFLAQDGEIENAKMSKSIYKEKDHKTLINNTVSSQKNMDNDKQTLKPQVLYPTFAVEKLIGERIDVRIKNYIKGMMTNLRQEHGVHFSSPEQTFAEIIFTLTNQQQLKQVETIQHKVQIIAKLLREKRWRTPKGFYNHADYGQYFRKLPEKLNVVKSEVKTSATAAQYEKKRLLKQKQDELGDIKRSIMSEKRHLELITREQQKGIDKQALLDTIQRQLKRFEEKACVLEQEINILEQEFAPICKQSQDIHLQKTFTLNQLQDKADLLRLAIATQFERLCEAIESLPKGHQAIEKHQHDYERLQANLVSLENSISELEYELYCHQAA